MSIPNASKYVIIGAGIHGLSTAYHLALELKKRNLGGGEDILVIDKSGIGSGASGIACGVVRNNYFQPAMRELMAHSVEVWESDPEAYSYHPVGYMQISPELMRDDVRSNPHPEIIENRISSGISPYHARAQPDCSFCFVHGDHRGIYWN